MVNLLLVFVIFLSILSHQTVCKNTFPESRPSEGFNNSAWSHFKPFLVCGSRPASRLVICSFRRFRTLTQILPGLLLLYGDIISQPGPRRDSRHSSIKCLGINARSLKSLHRVEWSTVCNIQCVQELVCSEDVDIVMINETWLDTNTYDQELFHCGYTIYRKDQNNRGGGGVLIALKQDSFNSVQEYTPDIATTSCKIVETLSLKNTFSNFQYSAYLEFKPFPLPLPSPPFNVDCLSSQHFFVLLATLIRGGRGAAV